MTTFAAWVEHVGADVPGADLPVLTDAVRDAVIEFCERTRLYKHDVPAIDVVGLTSTYTLTLPTGTRLWDVIHAEHNGKEIHPRSHNQLDDLIYRWRQSDTTGVPEYYYITSDRTGLRLVRTPADSLTGGLVLEVALKPTRAAVDCPDFILEDHKYCIQSGAKWKLFAMQKKPWSDPQRAAYHMGEFASGCGDGSMMADRENTRAPLRVTAWR